MPYIHAARPRNRPSHPRRRPSWLCRRLNRSSTHHPTYPPDLWSVWVRRGCHWISVLGVRTPRTFLPWLALGLITAGAAALRLVDLGAVRLDPFYDAAVRSMGLSWHNFFFGAYEPGGSVSIAKPPVDLWLQVATVKLFG